MADFDAFTAERILAIPETSPERLFSGNAGAVTDQFRALVKLWPPDRDRHVFQRLVALRKAAFKRFVETGAEDNKLSLNEHMVRAADGRLFRFWFLRRHEFELGTMFVGKTHVTFVVRPEFTRFHDNALAAIRGLRFDGIPNPERQERQMPHVKTAFEAEGGGHVLALAKTPDLILLRDLMDHLAPTGGLDPRHAAWVLSTLHDMACYLSAAGMTHNAIGPDTLFVTPEHHGGVLLGGWFYAAGVGKLMLGVPSRTAAAAPSSLLREKRGDSRVDLELVKTTGREMLGDLSGTNLLSTRGLPAALVDWLRAPTSGDAVGDYGGWEWARGAAFGPRRFLPLAVTPSNVYGPNAIGN